MSSCMQSVSMEVVSHEKREPNNCVPNAFKKKSRSDCVLYKYTFFVDFNSLLRSLSFTFQNSPSIFAHMFTSSARTLNFMFLQKAVYPSQDIFFWLILCLL